MILQTLHERLAQSIGLFAEGIHDPDGAVRSIVPEVFRVEFGQAVALSVSPKVRVKPGELVRGSPSKGSAQKQFIGVQDLEIMQKLLGFADRVFQS